MRISLIAKPLAWLVCAVTLLTLQSCEESTPAVEGTEEQKPTPQITISDIEVSASTVKFNIETKDATRLKYSVVESSESENFVEVFSSKPQSITVNKLAIGKDYTITAYAYSRDEVESEVAKATFMTEDQTTYPRNMLALKFTGTWCGNCPYMTAALDDANEQLGGKIKIVAIHSEISSMMYNLQCAGGEELTSHWNVTSFPTTYLDYREKCNSSSADIVSLYKSAVTKHSATSDLAIISKVEGGELAVEVKVKVGASARYKIGAVVSEDNIHVSGTVGTNDDYYHHVSREFMSDVMGDALGKIAKGDVVEHSFNCALSDEWAVENLEVVVFVQKEESVNQFYTNNVKSVPVGANVDFADVN